MSPSGWKQGWDLNPRQHTKLTPNHYLEGGGPQQEGRKDLWIKTATTGTHQVQQPVGAKSLFCLTLLSKEQLKHALQTEKTSPESQKTISGSVSEKPDSQHLSCRAFRSMLPALARGVYAEPKLQVTHGEKMNWKKQAKSPCLQVTVTLPPAICQS